MMRELGGVFGIAVAVAVFAGAGSYASPQAFTDGFAPAILVAAGLALAGAVAGLALPGRRAATAPLVAPRPGGTAMRQVMVRYKVKPERVGRERGSSCAPSTRSCSAPRPPGCATRRSGSRTA